MPINAWDVMFPLVNKTVQRQCKETHGLHPSFRLKKRLGDLDCWRIFFFLEELTCLLFFVQKVSFQFSTTGLLRHRCIISTLAICQDSGYKYTGWLIGQLSARTILSHTHISIFIQEVFLLILFPTSPFPI